MSAVGERESNGRAGRGRSSSAGTSRSGPSGTSGRGRQASAGTRKVASAGKRQSSRSTSRSTAKNGARASATGRNGKTASATARNGKTSANGRASHDASGTLAGIGISVLSAGIGVAGGILLGRTALQRHRKVLGIPVANKIDLSGVGQQIGEAGRQFGKLAGEVRTVREKAEQIGRALS